MRKQRNRMSRMGRRHEARAPGMRSTHCVRDISSFDLARCFLFIIHYDPNEIYTSSTNEGSCASSALDEGSVAEITLHVRPRYEAGFVDQEAAGSKMV